MRHAKEPSLFNGHECPGQNLNPLPVMMASPYAWKIIEWDDKPQTNKNKQTNKKVFDEIHEINSLIVLPQCVSHDWNEIVF